MASHLAIAAGVTPILRASSVWLIPELSRCFRSASSVGSGRGSRAHAGYEQTTGGPRVRLSPRVKRSSRRPALSSSAILRSVLPRRPNALTKSVRVSAGRLVISSSTRTACPPDGSDSELMALNGEEARLRLEPTALDLGDVRATHPAKTC